MELELYQVDAFTNKVFGGNPAAVCPLETWIDASLMQRIAEENNLAETVFFVKKDNQYEIRWFMPHAEIDLCGHATLAAAFVICNYLDSSIDTVHFTSQSGPLIARKMMDGTIVLDFPSRPPEVIPVPVAVFKAFNHRPIAAFASRDLILLFESEAEIQSLTYDLSGLKDLPYLGIVATAEGTTADFVSRVFDANASMPEDPVTGSAHASLIPFWQEKLNKNDLIAKQLSPRGGDLICTLAGDRVHIAGKAVLYMKGTIFLPDRE